MGWNNAAVPASTPQGVLSGGYAAATTTLAAASYAAETDLGTTALALHVIVTTATGRRYRVTASLEVATGAGDTLRTHIKDDLGVYYDFNDSQASITTANQYPIMITNFIPGVNNASPAGLRTFTITALRVGGTGTSVLGGEVNNPAWIQIEDIGNN